MRKKAESSTHKLPHRVKIHLNRKETANHHHFHHYHRHSSPNGTVGHLSRKHHGPMNESHSAWYRDYKRTLASQGNFQLASCSVKSVFLPLKPKIDSPTTEDPEVRANRFVQSSSNNSNTRQLLRESFLLALFFAVLASRLVTF